MAVKSSKLTPDKDVELLKAVIRANGGLTRTGAAFWAEVGNLMDPPITEIAARKRYNKHKPEKTEVGSEAEDDRTLDSAPTTEKKKPARKRGRPVKIKALKKVAKADEKSEEEEKEEEEEEDPGLVEVEDQDQPDEKQNAQTTNRKKKHDLDVVEEEDRPNPPAPKKARATKAKNPKQTTPLDLPQSEEDDQDPKNATPKEELEVGEDAESET